MEINQKIKFDKKLHKYWDRNGNELISVTTLIHKFVPTFDPFGHILRNCAKKRGISPKEMKKEWDGIAKISTDKGTKFHKNIEDYINTGIITDNENKDLIEQFSNIKFNGKLETEKQIFNLDDKIAGTVDILEHLDKNTVNIFDIKTGKRLDKKARYGGYLLKPLEHIENANFNIYQLQLNTYRNILEHNGLWVENLIILYINPETQKIETHPVKYLTEEVKEMLKYYKQSIEVEDFI